MTELRDPKERVLHMQNMLVAHATNGIADNGEYQVLRQSLLAEKGVAEHLPQYIRTCCDLAQFKSFVVRDRPTWASRREYIWESFAPLLALLEGGATRPVDQVVADGFDRFDAKGVQDAWQKALARRDVDPEGAITAARTLLEAVCKHVLDDANVQYEKGKADLPELYRLVAKELKLAPDQHSQEVFRQILGGVTSVVQGLGAMRNRLGDAHGQGRVAVRPAARHAQLAVNLAGTAALFIIETSLARAKQ